MKDKEVKLDRSCHVLYSKVCKRQIQEKLAKIPIINANRPLVKKLLHTSFSLAKKRCDQ